MEEELNPRNFGEDDALLFRDKAYKGGRITKVLKEIFLHEIANKIADNLRHKGLEIFPHDKDNKHYFGEGVDCEILKPGARGWRKGRLKINVSFEFIPDEAELEGSLLETSPIEDIRR